PFSEHDLLLVAAGECPGNRQGRRRFDTKRAHRTLDRDRFSCPVGQKFTRHGSETSERHIVEDRLVEYQAVAFSVFGYKADPGTDRVGWRNNASLAALDGDLP